MRPRPENDEIPPAKIARAGNRSPQDRIRALELQLAKEKKEREKERAKEKKEREKVEQMIAKEKKERRKAELKAAKEKKAREKVEQKMASYSLRRLIVDPPEMVLNARCSQTSYSSKHAPAIRAKVHSDFHMETVDPKHSGGRPSRLLQKFNADKEEDEEEDTKVLQFSYSNEAQISGLSCASLEDAIILATKATGRTFSPREQSRLTSNRPDRILLVDGETNDPILAMEDKQPFRTGKAIPETVYGQVFDYMMELRALGHSAPFVVLTTFSKSWLLWQAKDEQSTAVASRKNRLQHIMSVMPKSPPKSRGTQKKSPPAPELMFDKIFKDNADKTKWTSEFVDLDRNEYALSRTRAYGSQELVPLLYTAILCGLTRNPAAPCKQVFKRKHYDNVALKLEKGTCQWGKLKLKVGEPIRLKQGTCGGIESNSPEGTYFALKLIGRGATAKVYEAYDHNGHACVIKMYVKQGDNKKGQSVNNAQSRKKGKPICQREVQRLEAFYPFLRGKVSFQILNQFPCVVMPFFEPLTEMERKESRDQIEKCLSSFTDNSGKKWKYKECDLRWRHVAKYVDEGAGIGEAREKIVMFDLAELAFVRKKEATMEFVKSQADALFERL